VAERSEVVSTSSTGVQVIRRVATILRAVKDAPSGLSLAELGRVVGLPRSTVHRIVKTLAEDGLLTVGPNQNGVRLGPELAQLAGAARRSLLNIARTQMEEMARAANETVDLAIWQGDSVRFVDQVIGDQRLRAEVIVGMTFPAYCTANGKAFLAELHPSALATYLATNKLVKLTPHTTVSRAKLIKELNEIRETGVAFDREEHTEMICAVGLVVHDVRDGGVAAITIAAPAQRFYDRENFLAEMILDGKRQIEEELSRS
jgi:DNA-binding IclR family transcriptional regulator